MFFAVTQLTPQITRWRILSPEATVKRVQNRVRHLVCHTDRTRPDQYRWPVDPKTRLQHWLVDFTVLLWWVEPETSPPAAAALRRVEVDRYVDAEAEWQTGLWLQYSTLTSRNFRRHRARYFSRLLYGQKIFIAVMTGLVWFRMKRTEDTARDRLGMVCEEEIRHSRWID